MHSVAKPVNGINSRWAHKRKDAIYLSGCAALLTVLYLCLEPRVHFWDTEVTLNLLSGGILNTHKKQKSTHPFNWSPEACFEIFSGRQRGHPQSGFYLFWIHSGLLVEHYWSVYCTYLHSFTLLSFQFLEPLRTRWLEESKTQLQQYCDDVTQLPQGVCLHHLPLLAWTLHGLNILTTLQWFFWCRQVCLNITLSPLR